MADLNDDGRVDMLVMSEGGRPRVMRNTSYNGEIAFVEWTPGDTIGNGQFQGWHAAVFDADDDGDLDVMIGASAGEHLLYNTDSNEVNEADLGGVLPAAYNTDPVAVVGEVVDVDMYDIPSMPSNSKIAIIINGCGDYTLELLNGASVVATSDRGGMSVEEGVSATAGGANLSIRVTLNQACGDVDGDGDIDATDLAQGCEDASDCPELDFDGDGDFDFADFGGYQIQHTGPGGDASSSYILEVLARN